MKIPTREPGQMHVDSPPRIFPDGSMYFTYNGVRYYAMEAVPKGLRAWGKDKFVPPPEEALREAIMLLELSR